MTEISVSCIDDLSEADIWKIGDAVGQIGRNKAAKARADFSASAVIQIHIPGISMTVEAEPIPGNSRHMHVCGWPQNDKSRRMLIAQELAAKSRLKIREQSIAAF